MKGVGTRTLLALTAMSLLFGGSFVASKGALATFTPVQLIFLRFTLASAAFACLAPILKLSRMDLRGHLSVGAVALMEPVLYFYLEAEGIRRTYASTASILISTIPLFVLCLEALWLSVRITLAEILLVLLSMVGIVVLVTAGGWREVIGGMLSGNLLVLGAALIASVYTLLVQGLLARYGAMTITAYQCFYASAVFLPFAAREWYAFGWTGARTSAWLQVAFLGLGCSTLAYWLMNYSLSKARAGLVAAFANVIPVVGTGLAVLLLGERLHAQQVLGAALVLAGVAALSWVHRRRRDEG